MLDIKLIFDVVWGPLAGGGQKRPLQPPTITLWGFPIVKLHIVLWTLKFPIAMKGLESYSRGYVGLLEIPLYLLVGTEHSDVASYWWQRDCHCQQHSLKSDWGICTHTCHVQYGHFTNRVVNFLPMYLQNILGVSILAPYPLNSNAYRLASTEEQLKRPACYKHWQFHCKSVVMTCVVFGISNDSLDSTHYPNAHHWATHTAILIFVSVSTPNHKRSFFGDDL